VKVIEWHVEVAKRKTVESSHTTVRGASTAGVKRNSWGKNGASAGSGRDLLEIRWVKRFSLELGPGKKNSELKRALVQNRRTFPLHVNSKVLPGKGPTVLGYEQS